MKKYILILVTLLITFSYSQAKKTLQPLYNASQVDIRPEFKGGMTPFYSYLNENLKLPTDVELKGKIYAEFIIELDGTITNIKIIKDLGYGTDIETKRVLEKSLNWNPGQKAGKAVRTKVVMPIIINDWK